MKAGHTYCISLWRPWPYFIAVRLKTIETRTTWLRLPEYLIGRRLAIHAAQKVDATAVGRIFAATGARMAIPREYADMPTGIICHAKVHNVRRLNSLIDARSALCLCEGDAGICLTDIVRLDPPVPYRGHQGLFYVPNHLLGLEEAR